MIVTAGIDVGTSAVKVAIMSSEEGGGRARPGAKVLGKAVERIRRRDQSEIINLVYKDAIEASGVNVDAIDYVATTGEGELVDFRTGHFYGMTAHARGALFLDPEVRAVVDVGSLHGRAIKLDERSKVLGYRMTSQCASGSGQFLENIARYLGVSLDEIGPMSLTSTTAEKISGICAVLAETDVINMVSRGIAVQDILRGIHESMGNRFIKLLRSAKAEGVVLITGGLAADTGLLGCMQDMVDAQTRLKVTIRTHADSVYAGAMGAALWGAYRHERLGERNAA